MLGWCAKELSKFSGIKRDEVLKINRHETYHETPLAAASLQRSSKHVNMTSLCSLTIGGSFHFKSCQMAERVGNSEAIVIIRHLNP